MPKPAFTGSTTAGEGEADPGPAQEDASGHSKSLNAEFDGD
jgi:hypothetical protein